MKKLFLKYVPVLLLLLTGPAVQAQTGPPEMADTMRSDGKIWVVIAVIGVILAGLLVYLALLDRKIGKVEKELKQKGTK